MDTDNQLMEMVKGEPWCGVDQQNPENLYIKEEQKEVSTSLEGEQLNLQETDVARFPFTAVSIKSEDDEEKPLFSQLHQQQIEDRDVPTSSSADQMTAETSRNPDLNPHEPTPDSSETEVSGDDEEDDDINLDSKRSVSGPEAGDGDKDLNESRSFELDVKTVNTTFSCPECGKQFLRKSSLQKHMIMTSHSAIESSGCLVNKECVGVKKRVDSSSKDQKELKSHKCDFCGKGFRYKSTLISHMSVHTGEKPFACELCGKRFRRKSGLTRHMIVHTRQKPFGCELCEQRFSQKPHLDYHMGSHTGEKPYACGLCGQRFCQKSSVSNHMKVHTDRSPLPVSSVDKDLASRESTQTSSLTNGGVGSKQGELCSDPLKKSVYVLLKPLNISAEMGKITEEPIQASGEPNKEDNARGNLNSQTTCAANVPAAPLTRADIEVMLQGLENRITSKLSAQLAMDRALLEQRHSTIEEFETSINDMHNWMSELETTCSVLMQENEELKLKTYGSENGSTCNNICITGLPEKAEGPYSTVFITECLTEIFGPEAFPMPLVVDVAHRFGVPRRNQKAPRPFIARVHHFQNKELILKLTQERGRLTYRGKEIYIFPDYGPKYPSRGPPSRKSRYRLGTPAIRRKRSSLQGCKSQTKLDKN